MTDKPSRITSSQLPITNYAYAIRILLIVLPFVLHARTLTIASYNVENLFDMQHDGQEYAEYVPGRHGWREAMLAKKIRNITEVICDLDADVVGLQEVEHDRVLARLQRSLERVGCRYRYRAITRTPATPVHVALLSRIPLKRTRDVPVTRYGHQRSILEAVLDTEPPLRLFVNHWRSKRGPESERIVYARTLAKRLAVLPLGTEYVVLGDFNSDWDESRTIDPRHNDTGGRTGINDVLRTMRNGKPVRLDTIGAGEHYSLWLEVGIAQRWSHNFFGDKEAIDAILIPSSLHDGQGWEYVADSFRVYRPRYLFGRHGAIKRWAYKHGKHLGHGYSDHLPIVATFSTEGSGTLAQPDMPAWWERALAWIGGLFADTPPPQSVIMHPAPHVQSPNATEPASPPAKARPSLPQRPSVSIAELKKRIPLTAPVWIGNAHVVFKRGESAVIGQDPSGEAILLYRAARQLEEGHCYDLIAYKSKRYKGFDELTDVEIDRDRGACDTATFVQPFDPETLRDKRAVGRVVRSIAGRYEGRTIRIGATAVPIHFRRKAGRPKKGAQLRIDRAQIGYYKDHAELVVWSKNDYETE
jgi:endonuclease/exonuclease/phosphatase family metal-dependent hydrolase